MATEIERKFLVLNDDWRQAATRTLEIAQAYLAGPPAARCSVRVRVQDDAAFLNIKSATSGVERDEYDYAVPVPDARRMIETLAGALVAKRRHLVDVDGHVFEIDEFLGENLGLIVAEIELDRIDREFSRPAWLGREVSSLRRYYNHDLARYPFAQWSDDERNALDAA